MQEAKVVVEKTKSRFRVYRVIGILIFINTLIVYFDRVNISIVAPTMMKYFQWDMGVMGLAMSMFGVGYIITQIPGGYLADKLGGRKILGYGSLGWSFFTFLTPFANTPTFMYMVRALLGLGEGVNFPAETSVLSRWLPRKVRARIQGFNLSGIAAGPLIATPLTVWIMAVFGWQAVFYFYAALGLTWTAVWLAYSKDNPAQHKGVTGEELQEIATGQVEEAGETVVGAPARSTAVWGLAIAYFCFTYTYWLFINWLPTYLIQARGFTVIKMGFFASLPWLAAFISMNVAGWISDGLVKKGFTTGKARRALIYTGVPGMAVCLLLATQATNAYTAIALITVTMMFAGLNFPSFWSLPMDMHAQKSGLISGMMNTGSGLASILAPGITGYVAMLSGWTAALSLASVLAIISVIVLYFTAPKSAGKGSLIK
ncbi:MAG: putative sulfoacetate transporter SauU [Smithella sp. PtaU1.Bin162]|nr:MAG: putative sulfoacetate transporter SauU [Smithella sp. PtaU1.Bin162]